MAISQNMTTDNKYIVYYVEVLQNSQNIANNTSNVTVKVWAKRTNTGFDTLGNGTVYCTIDGTQYTSTITSSQVIDSPIVLFNKSLTINHNSDGTKTLNIGARIQHSRFVSSPTTQNYSYRLSDIPRSSTFSIPTSINAGSTLTINIDRKVSSFRHKVFYTFGKYSVTILDTGSTSISPTYGIPLGHLDVIPNSVSGTATIKVETYNGNTMIGQQSKNITINAPSNIIPTFTGFTVAPVDVGASTSFGYVQGKSKAKCTVSGQLGIYGSSIKSATITGAGFTGNSNPFETGVLSKSGTFEFSAYVTDSRGRNSATRKVSINVLPYENPKISKFNVIRCLVDGTPNEDGKYFKADLSYTISPVDNKNSATAKIFYKLSSATSYPTTSSIIQNNSTLVDGGGNILNDKSYDVKVEVTDKFHTSTLVINIGQSFITLDFKKGGKGIAIGKASETDNLLEIDIPVKFNKNIEMVNTNFMRLKKFGEYVYWGMVDVDNSESQFIRTTSSGLLPYQPSGASNLGTDGWPFYWIYGKNFIVQNILECKGTPTGGGANIFCNGTPSTSNGKHITINTSHDNNGVGDKMTHLGYRTTNGYNHYFRGTGGFFVDNKGGINLTGSTVYANTIRMGSTSDSNWRPIEFFRTWQSNTWGAKMGASYQSAQLESSSQTTNKFGAYIESNASDGSAIRRYGFLNECFIPANDNNTYNGTSSHRWVRIYATAGVVNSCSKEEKKNIKQINKNNARELEDDYTKNTIIEGLKNSNLYSYSYINSVEEKTLDDDIFIGFLGEDLEANNPDFFKLIGSSYVKEETGIKQYDIRQTSLVGVLWSGLQQALNKIDELENRLNILENN